MIYELNTDFPNFTPIRFQRGINIVLAKRVKNTSNGVGKTMMLACIDFVLGAEYKKSLLANYRRLQNTVVSLTIDFEGKKVIASRKISEKGAKTIDIYSFENKSVQSITVANWKKRLLVDKFGYRGNEPLLTWRNLLKLFFKDELVKDFKMGMKSFNGDNAQKVSVYQSFLLNIAFEEISRNYETGSLKNDGKNITNYVTKLKSVMDKSIELTPEDIDYSTFQEKIDLEIQKERLNIIFNQENIDALSLRLSKLTNSIRNLEKSQKNINVNDLYNVLESELADFIKHSFSEAQKFHDNLSFENNQVINDEVTVVENEINNFNESLKSSQNNLKQLLSLKKQKTDDLPNAVRTNLVLNEFLSKPSNEIPKEINSRIKEISNDRTIKIQNEISSNEDLIATYCAWRL